MASPASTASQNIDPSGGSLPPPSMSPAAKVAGEVIAITLRDDFLLELSESLSGQASVRPVDSMAVALSYLASSRKSHVLVLDTRDMTDVRGDVETAMSQGAGTTLLVFAPAEIERGLTAALKGSSVYAVLPFPLDKRRTAAVFEGAIADAVAKRSAARAAEPPRGSEARIETKADTSFNPDPLRLAGPDEPPTPQISKAVWVGVAVAVIAVGGGGYLLMSKEESLAPPANAPIARSEPETQAPAPVADAGSQPNSVVEVPLVTGRTDELLEKARLAMKERRYTSPANDNALLYYRSALAGDPSNGEASDGMARVSNLLLTRFEESMTAGRFDEAAEALGGLKLATPTDQRLAGLEARLVQSQINKALSENNVDRAEQLMRQAQQANAVPPEQVKKWGAEIAHRRDDVQTKRLVDLGNDALQKGRLIDGEDSAKAYLDQLKQTPGTNASAVRLQRELVAALLRKARDAMVAKAQPEADRWIVEARAAGATAAEIASYNRDVTAAKQKAAVAETDRYAQLLRERIRDGRLTEPANDSAMYYLAMLNSSDSTGATSTSVGRELSAKLIDRASGAARDGRTAQMDADLAAARRLGADPSALAEVQALASARTKSIATTTASITPRPTPAQPNKLKRLRYAPPEYPQKAFQQKLTGSVTVEFVVDVNGEPRDARVVDADPPEVFDKAALNAVKKWRYEPVVMNNVPTEVPTRMVIRFELPK